MTVRHDEASALASFYQDVDGVDLAPLWTITEQLLTPHPRPAAVPWLWSARTYRPLAARAIELVPVERGGERRVLSLRNPASAAGPTPPERSGEPSSASARARALRHTGTRPARSGSYCPAEACSPPSTATPATCTPGTSS